MEERLFSSCPCLRRSISSSKPQSFRWHISCRKRIQMTPGTNETRKSEEWALKTAQWLCCSNSQLCQGMVKHQEICRTREAWELASVVKTHMGLLNQFICWKYINFLFKSTHHTKYEALVLQLKNTIPLLYFTIKIPKVPNNSENRV